MGPVHLQITNGQKKSKCLNFIHEVREEKKYMYLGFGKTAPRYFEKEVTATVKAPRCSLRCKGRSRSKVNCIRAQEGSQVAIPLFGLGR